MPINQADIEKVAQLAHLELAQEELKTFGAQIAEIVSYVMAEGYEHGKKSKTDHNHSPGSDRHHVHSPRPEDGGDHSGG